jgi:hypothetical protein
LCRAHVSHQKKRNPFHVGRGEITESFTVCKQDINRHCRVVAIESEIN